MESREDLISRYAEYIKKGVNLEDALADFADEIAEMVIRTIQYGG